MYINRSYLAAAMLLAASGLSTLSHAGAIVGTDLNSNSGANEGINQLYSANRGTNGGGDQSLQFGDQLYGTYHDDIIVGGLGIDVLFGYQGDDVLIGGTEDFNGFNRDRAFGHEGNDSFVWTPGDGNDFFDGGTGEDVLVIGLIGESRDATGSTENAPVFAVSPPGTEGSQDFDGIFLHPDTGLPLVDVLNGPGFCEVLDSATPGMDELNIDHLVRFTLRGPANAFDQAVAADPNVDTDSLDTGLRIAVHLKNTEFVVCGSRNGQEIEVFDLRESPVKAATISDLPAAALRLLLL